MAPANGRFRAWETPSARHRFSPAGEPAGCVVFVGSDADVRAVDAPIELVRQRSGREAVAVQDHGPPSSAQLHIDGSRKSPMMRVIEGVHELFPLLTARLLPQPGTSGRTGVDDTHPHCSHGLPGIIREPLGVDHQPRNRVNEDSVAPLRMAAEQVVRVPVGDLQALLGELPIAEDDPGANVGRDRSRCVRDVKDHLWSALPGVFLRTGFPCRERVLRELRGAWGFMRPASTIRI